MCYGIRKEEMVGRRDTLLLSILTFVTVIAWIMFEVYHAQVDSTIPPEVTAQLVPITPRFDQTVIAEVKQRQVVEPLTEGKIVPSGQPVPTSIPITPKVTPKPGGV